MVDNAVINERGGAKADAGKTRYDLLVPEFIQGMANVMTFGATKYSDWNWVNLERDRIIASLWRHIIEYQQEKMFDKETNLSHLYHAGCNLMMLDYLDSPEKPKKESPTLEHHKGLYRAFQNRMRQMHGQYGMSLNDLAEHVEIDRDTLYKMMQDISDEHYRFYTAQQYAEKLSFTYQTDNE